LFFQLPGFPIGLMRLFDKFHWLTGISVAESAGRLAAAFILFLTHSGLPAYIYAYGTVLVTANLIRIAASFYLLHVETGSFRHPSLREIRAVARTFLRFSTGSWITSTLNVTRRDGSIFIVAAILGSAGAGYYSIAQRIVQPIKDVSEMLRQALFPELSRLVAKGEHKQVAELIRRVLFYTVPLAATIIIGVLLFGNVAVNLVAGPAFDKAYWILLGLATASSLYLCMPLLSSLVILYAGMKSYSTATAIAAAIWAALVTFPIYLWYARGAGVGEVIFVVSWLTICTVILRKSFARRIASGR
jgi:O-antigen/teichoic acid export membrane protein